MLTIAAQTWNELLQSSDADCLFLTWEWMDTWWRHLGAGRELSIVLAHQDSDLIGLAPLCVSPRRLYGGRLLPEAVFLGGGFAGSDYLDVIVRRGYEGLACKRLAEELATERRSIRWNNVRHGVCAVESVAARLKSGGWSIAETIVNACPFIALAGHTWESYLASLGSEHRYSFHRKWRRLNRDYEVQFEQVRTKEECVAGLDALLRLHNLRWRGRGTSDAFHTPELVRFHQEFAQIALAQGWLRLFILNLNGKPAAALYGFFYGHKFYFYQSGFDPEYEKCSVGLITMGLAIRRAIEEGAEEFDLLHGEEAYKRHWAGSERVLSRLELYPPGVFGRIQESTKALARSASGAFRRAAEAAGRKRSVAA